MPVHPAQPSRGPGVARGRLPAARWLRWAAVGVATVGLLLAFDRVVRQGVAQGAARQAVTAERAQAAGRCNLMPNRREREACRAAPP